MNESGRLVGLLNFTKKVRAIFLVNCASAFLNFMTTLLIVWLLSHEEMGSYSIWLSYVFIVGSVISLRFEQALYICKENEIRTLAAICVCLIVLISTTIGILLSVSEIYASTNLRDINAIYVILGFIAYGCFNISYPLVIRMYPLSKVAFYKFAINAMLFFFVLCMYMLDNLNVDRLLIGFISSYFLVPSAVLAILFFGSKFEFQIDRCYRKIMGKYAEFPKYDSISVLAHTLSMNLHYIVLPFLFTVKEIGVLAVILRMSEGILLFVGNPMQIYFNKLAFAGTGENSYQVVIDTYHKTFFVLLLLGLFGFGTFGFFMYAYYSVYLQSVPDDFAVLLLAVTFWKYCELCVYPTTTILFFYKQQNWLSRTRFLTLSLKLVSCVLFIKLDFGSSFLILGIISGLYYMIILYKIKSLIKN